MSDLPKDLAGRFTGFSDKKIGCFPSDRKNRKIGFSPADAIQVFTKAIHSSFKIKSSTQQDIRGMFMQFGLWKG